MHTAIAIKADGLMSMEKFNDRSTELIERIQARAPGIAIPGKRSFESKSEYDKTDLIEISDDLVNFFDVRTGKVKPDSLFTEDTLIAFLLKNDSAKAILDKYMASTLNKNQVDLYNVKAFPLKMIANFLPKHDCKACFDEIRNIKE